MAKAMVRAAKPVAGQLLVEGALREEVGSVQRFNQSRSGNPDQTGARCTIYHRDHRQCGVHICEWEIRLRSRILCALIIKNKIVKPSLSAV